MHKALHLTADEVDRIKGTSENGGAYRELDRRLEWNTPKTLRSFDPYTLDLIGYIVDERRDDIDRSIADKLVEAYKEIDPETRHSIWKRYGDDKGWSIRKWREKVGRGWATSFGESLGMSQNAKDMMDEGGMPTDAWDAMSDADKMKHIRFYYQGDNDEWLNRLDLSKLQEFMVEQPHHIEVPWWMNNGYTTEQEALGRIKADEINAVDEMLANPDEWADADDEDELADWIAERRERIRDIRSWSELSDVCGENGEAFYWDPYGTDSYDGVEVVWEDFIIFDGQMFDEWAEDMGKACSCRDPDERLTKDDRTYLKGFSDEAWYKFLAKDTYSYIRYNREEIVEVLMAGRRIAEHFKTCTIAQVKEIYINMVDLVLQQRWSVAGMEDAVLEANPDLTRMQVSRIVQTELGRIIMYAKEQAAITDNRANNAFYWSGPLDDRTTPMCRFLQTGELDGTYRYMKGDYDLEALRSELPEWRKEGWTLPELKHVLHDTWAVFNKYGLITTPMVGDWIVHIGCRHTFHERSRITADREADADVPYDITDTGSHIPANVPVANTVMSLSGADDVTAHVIEGIDIGVAFLNGMNFKPTYYQPDDEDDEGYVTFLFTTVNERQAAEWAKTILHLQDADVDDVSLVWLIHDESTMTDDEIDFICSHAPLISDMGDALGWV